MVKCCLEIEIHIKTLVKLFKYTIISKNHYFCGYSGQVEDKGFGAGQPQRIFLKNKKYPLMLTRTPFPPVL